MTNASRLSLSEIHRRFADGKLIVSCQALPGEPLFGSEIMSKLAIAAEAGGAAGIRANSPADIRAIRAVTALPVIGLSKIDVPRFEVYITPTIDEAMAVAEAGADIIALDATDRPHPEGNVADFIRRVREVTQRPVLADIATFEEALAAESAGADFISTTMSGYTPQSPPMEEPDLELVARLAKALRVPLIAEGRIATPEMAREALRLGAFAVVVGGAITRPQQITTRFRRALGPHMNAYLGIDIGGTKIAAGLVTEEGEVRARTVCRTPTELGGAGVLAAAIYQARLLADEHRYISLGGIGVGAGGQIDAETGIVLSATEVLPGWSGTPVGPTFEAELHLPTFVDNDVNALAAGEGRFGAGAGLPTVVFVALGTGVGGALLLAGRLHHGAHWSGGEFGHLLLSMDPDARLDDGGHRGTLEAYASGGGLVKTWREIGGVATAHLPENPTGLEIQEESLRDPDGRAARAVALTGEYLGYGLVSLANALDPDRIIVGGGLAALGARLLDPATAILRKYALPGPATCPVVVPALGADAPVVGAASLAMPTIPEIKTHAPKLQLRTQGRPRPA